MADKKIVFGGITLTVIAGVTIFMLVFAGKEKSNIRIKGFRVEPTVLVPEKEYVKSAGLQSGASLTKDSLPAIRERLVNHPFVERVSLEVHSDTLLDVKITEKNIECLMLRGDKKYFLTSAGDILQVTAGIKDFDLPVVTGMTDSIFTMKKMPVKQLKTITGILHSLHGAGERSVFGKVNELHWSEGRDLLISFSEIAPLIVLSRASLAYGIAGIIALEQSKTQQKDILDNASYIDLRYAGKMFAGFGTVNKEEPEDERNSSSN